MRFTPCHRVGWLLGNTLLFGAVLSGEPVAQNQEAAAAGETATMQGIFNTELPRLIRPESLRLTVRPHFGDFVNHDHLRLTFGARYGLTPQWELGTDVDVYVSHGLGDAKVGEEVGISRIRLGVKYRFSDFLLPYWQTVAGLKYSFPVGNPPPDLTDGLQHITPYMTLAHDWESRPAFTTFISYGVDFVTDSGVSGIVEDGELDATNWFITPGVVWHRGVCDYSLEAVFASTLGLDSTAAYRVTLRPGVKWTLPPQLTFHSRSRWILGVSVHSDYTSSGTTFGAGVRLQTDFDFKRLFKSRHRTEVDPPK